MKSVFFLQNFSHYGYINTKIQMIKLKFTSETKDWGKNQECFITQFSHVFIIFQNSLLFKKMINKEDVIVM